MGAYGARTHLPALPRGVERCDRTTITRCGVPVAEFVPPGGAARPGLSESFSEFRAFGGGRALGPDLGLRDLIDDGRR